MDVYSGVEHFTLVVYKYLLWEVMTYFVFSFQIGKASESGFKVKILSHVREFKRFKFSNCFEI